MQTFDLKQLLNENEYPGRGICLGIDESDKYALVFYFIMGRSVNSRNRVFVPQQDGGILTRAFDESKMLDPSLIIYAPVRIPSSGTLIVTNGDQTDTIYDFIEAGKTFEDALRTRTFEPDAPNFTPRISGLLSVAEGKAAYKLSILKSDCGDENSVQRFFYEYPQPAAGTGHFIHTYRCNGEPIPSFEGEPERVTLHGSFDELMDDVWHALNEDNKVSLYGCAINLATGQKTTRIINKLQ